MWLYGKCAKEEFLKALILSWEWLVQISWHAFFPDMQAFTKSLVFFVQKIIELQMGKKL